ncbi:uncharacterized protein LOC130774792 [Actinidia eriantha]|uniref:uncharacterized protein LOC130774792 n=1 Tax=Actinidia eriantha TaxID=165200 RepID=UPI00258995FF|nr:uncharacterized protein LOC130774792 [Actinidia eriantha]
MCESTFISKKSKYSMEIEFRFRPRTTTLDSPPAPESRRLLQQPQHQHRRRHQHHYREHHHHQPPLPRRRFRFQRLRRTRSPRRHGCLLRRRVGHVRRQLPAGSLVLDRNRVLIQQVSENHQQKIHDNLVKNVALIQEINGNISKVVSLYSDLSVNFSSMFHQQNGAIDAKSNTRGLELSKSVSSKWFVCF